MVRTTPVVAGVDLDAVPLQDADAFVADLVRAAPQAGVDPAVLYVATHRVVTEQGQVHTVVTVTGSGLAEWHLWRMCTTVTRDHPTLACLVGRHTVGAGIALDAARSAIQERLLRIGGRSVHYPGVEHMTGAMTARHIVAESAIEVVCEVGGDELAPEARVVTAGALRPRWEFGALTLHVHHEVDGVHIPFESGSRITA